MYLLPLNLWQQCNCLTDDSIHKWPHLWLLLRGILSNIGSHDFLGGESSVHALCSLSLNFPCWLAEFPCIWCTCTMRWLILYYIFTTNYSLQTLTSLWPPLTFGVLLLVKCLSLVQSYCATWKSMISRIYYYALDDIYDAYDLNMFIPA